MNHRHRFEATCGQRNRPPVHIWLIWTLALAAVPGVAQQSVTARMTQDPILDHLVHAPGTELSAPDSLGRIDRAGTNPRAMILIPGAGLAPDIFGSFIEPRLDAYTFYTVTLAGFGGTPPPPMPPPGTSYGDQSWTRGARKAIERLILAEEIKRPIVVGHWLSAMQVALELALERPDLVRGVVLISGAPRIVPTSFPAPETLADRIAMVDRHLAPAWFKTVIAETWHDNNFLPRDCAVQPLRALQLWRQAATPDLPTWIRYLLEAWAQDVTLRLDRLSVPTLAIQPGFDDAFFAGPVDSSYMRMFCIDSWQQLENAPESLQVEFVPGARISILDDRPDELGRLVDAFVAGLP